MRLTPWLFTVAVCMATIAASSPSLAQSPDSQPAKGAPWSEPPAPAVTWQQAMTEVWVHLEGRKGAVLLQQTTSDGPWEAVCSAPCDVRLPIAQRYRVAARGLHESPDFMLEGSPGTHETLVVGRAGETAFVLGIVGLALGPTLVEVGGFFEFSLLGGDGPNPSVRDTGLALAGIGFVTFVVGLVLILNASSEAIVSQHLDANPAGPFPSDSWIRSPTWSTATTEPKGLQPAPGIPFFSGRF